MSKEVSGLSGGLGELRSHSSQAGGQLIAIHNLQALSFVFHVDR